MCIALKSSLASVMLLKVQTRIFGESFPSVTSEWYFFATNFKQNKALLTVWPYQAHRRCPGEGGGDGGICQ